MIDIEQILEKLQSIGLVRLKKVSGDYYTMYCPFHNNGQERKPSFGVLLREQHKNGQTYPAGWAHCFTCGYSKTLSNFISDLLKSKNMSGDGLEWLKQNIPGFDSNSSDIEPLIPIETITSLDASFAVRYIHNYTQPKYSYVTEEELTSYRFTVPYMYERKLTDAIIEKYDIGFDANHIPPGRKKPLPCITFPVRDMDGNTLFFCRRSIEGKYFNYPKDVTKPVYGLYELPKSCKSIVICESCLNSLSVTSFGYHSVALLGTGNAYQISQLRRLGVNEFVLCMDGDDAGRKATSKLKRALRDVGIVWTINMPDGKDANDCTKQEFDLLYENKE